MSSIFRKRAAIASQFMAVFAASTRLHLAGSKRLFLALIFSFIPLFGGGIASAQTLTQTTASPSTYTGAGETITFTIKFNTGNFNLGSASIESSLGGGGISYACTPQTSISTGANVTCTGSYTTTASDTGQLSEIATAKFTSESGTPIDISPQAVIRVDKVLPDADAPVVNVPSNITVSTDLGQSSAVVNFTPTATDDVGVTSLVSTPASGSTFALGTTTVSVTASDASGKTDTETFTVTVNDTEAPVVTVPSNITVGTDAGSSTAVVNFNTSATDNNALATLVSSPASGSTFPIGTTTVTVTAKDAANNTSTDTFTVTVNDTEAPVVTVPSNITVGTDAGSSTAVVNFVPTATDNLAVATLVSSPASGSAFPIGTTTVTVTAKDAANNTGTDTFTVTVNDTEAPVVTVPSNSTVGTDADLSTAVVNFTPTATDNLAVATLVSSPASGSAFPIGTTTVTVTAKDAADNTGTDTFTVTVNDTEAPAVTVPSNVTVGTDAGLASAVVSFTPTATDNDGVTSLISSPASGSTFALGTTIVTVTAIDAASNTTSETFSVTVEDDEAPVVTVPDDIVVGTEPGLASAVVSFTPTATDNHGVTSLIFSPASGSTFALGTTSVTVTATDATGNITSENFAVTVEDDEAPVFTSSQSDIDVEIDFNLSSAMVTFPTPTASDNSGDVTVTQTSGIASGENFPIGSTIVEFTATDGAGLTTTLQFTVTVALIPPGRVTFVVESPDDGTVHFRSGTPALNTAVVLFGGSGTSGSIEVVPGSYTADYSLPAGFAVTSGSCNSSNGTVNIGSKTFNMTFSRGETYVCTLYSRDIATQTGEQIQHFMDNRARQITSNQPDQGRRIARVNGNSHSKQISFGGNTVSRGLSPFGVEVTQDRVDLSFGSTSTSQDPMTAASDWDLWVEASISRYETSYGDGHFGILHAGADYRVKENAILGFGVQVDSVKEDVIGTIAKTEGIGWMFGPYYTARIGEGLYFDTSLKYGQATNQVSPLGTYTDDFRSERWLATVSLYGSIDRDALNIQPNVSINYFHETSDSYVDSLSVPIAARTSQLGDAELGSRFTLGDPRGHFSNYFEFHGIYTFESSGEIASIPTAETGLRGRLGVGGTTDIGKQGAIEYGIRYDGLGDSSYEAASVNIGYSSRF